MSQILTALLLVQQSDDVRANRYHDDDAPAVALGCVPGIVARDA